MLNLPWIRFWGVKGVSGIVEQGTFALAHMLTNVLLARWLLGEEYGRFATLYPVLILLNYVQAAMVLEPMLVQARKEKSPEAHVRAALRLQTRSSFLLAIALAFVGVAVGLGGKLELGWTLLGFALAAPSALLLLAVRKAFSALLLPHVAAACGAAYVPLVVALLWVLRELNWLGPGSAYVAAGVADLVILLVGIRMLPRTREPVPTASALLQEHWRVSRWLLWTTPLRWAPLNLAFVAIPILLVDGTVQVGVLRATFIVVAPIQHVQMALASLILPAFSERIHCGLGVPRYRLMSGLVGLSFVGFAVLLVLGDSLVAVLFGGSVKAPAHLLAVLGGIPVITAAIVVVQAELMASLRLNVVFASYVVGTVVTVTLGFKLIVDMGVLGAAWGSVAACTCILAMQWGGLHLGAAGRRP